MVIIPVTMLAGRRDIGFLDVGFWDFIRDEGNQKAIKWVAGCCGGLATAGVAVWNYFAPAPEPERDGSRSTPPIVSKLPCPDASSIRLKPEGFVFPDSHERQLTLAEVLALDDCNRWIARNEIYARKGRLPNGAFLRAHFSAQPWFRAKENYPDLTDLEWRNVETIKNVESR